MSNIIRGLSEILQSFQKWSLSKSRRIPESEVGIMREKMRTRKSKLIIKHLQAHYLDQYQMQLNILMARYVPQQMTWKLKDKEVLGNIL